MRREELVLAHQAQHTRTGGADIPQDAQPRPDLVVAFAGEGRGLQIGPDGDQGIGVRELGLRAASPGARGCALRIRKLIKVPIM